MLTGSITHLDDGWGFLRPDYTADEDAAPRVYFNRSGLQRFTLPFSALQVGQRVEFTPIAHPRGPRAIEVRVLADGVA